MDLNEVLVFVRVAQAGSFTAAATQLGIPKSTVSRRVAKLEERLKSRLLQRTTRQLSLTTDGRAYYEHCARIVEELEEAERALSGLQGTARGTLRVTAGVNCGPLGPVFLDYLKLHPEVQLELLCTGRAVDLVEERFDLAIRAGELKDSTYVARSLGRVEFWIVAAPAYLKKRGRPRSPQDLRAHDVLLFSIGLDGPVVRLENDDRTENVAVSPRMVASDNDVLLTVSAGGLGIALLPAFLCAADVRAHRLERVLPDWSGPSIPMHAVYPSRRHVSPKVKSLVDHLHERLTPLPWERARYGGRH
jgi:DNA-binding transcriptional LysR family regulator